MGTRQERRVTRAEARQALRNAVHGQSARSMVTVRAEDLAAVLGLPIVSDGTMLYVGEKPPPVSISYDV